jgi:hypothetical protein
MFEPEVHTPPLRLTDHLTDRLFYSSVHTHLCVHWSCSVNTLVAQDKTAPIGEAIQSNYEWFTQGRSGL